MSLPDENGGHEARWSVFQMVVVIYPERAVILKTNHKIMSDNQNINPSVVTTSTISNGSLAKANDIRKGFISR